MTRLQSVVGENPQAVDHGPGQDVGGSPGHHAQFIQPVTPRLVEPTAAVNLEELDPQVMPQFGEPCRRLSHRGPDNHPRLVTAEQHPPATHALHRSVSIRDPAGALPQQRTNQAVGPQHGVCAPVDHPEQQRQRSGEERRGWLTLLAGLRVRSEQPVERP